MARHLVGVSFQQDNAITNTTRMFLDCLCVVNTFPWPERSPDLLPIEHVWNMVKPHIRAPQNITDLKQPMVYAWHNVSQDGSRNLYHSLPRCITSTYRSQRRFHQLLI
ncbi:UNVERIFIED_CONTAM: tc3a [Trichonephila clavipes]